MIVYPVKWLMIIDWEGKLFSVWFVEVKWGLWGAGGGRPTKLDNDIVISIQIMSKNDNLPPLKYKNYIFSVF